MENEQITINELAGRIRRVENAVIAVTAIATQGNLERHASAAGNAADRAGSQVFLTFR